MGTALICFAVVILLLAIREPKVRVAFSLAGYTNDSRGTVLAKFRLVNEGSRSILRFGVYHLDTKQHPFDPTKPTNFFGLSPFRGRLLDPGQSEIIAIPVVTNQGAWRPLLRFENYGWRMSIQDGLGPMRINAPSWRWRLNRWLSATNHLISSHWIEEGEHGAQQTAPPNDGPATPRVSSDAYGGGRHR